MFSPFKCFILFYTSAAFKDYIGFISILISYYIRKYKTCSSRLGILYKIKLPRHILFKNSTNKEHNKAIKKKNRSTAVFQYLFTSFYLNGFWEYFPMCLFDMVPNWKFYILREKRGSIVCLLNFKNLYCLFIDER